MATVCITHASLRGGCCIVVMAIVLRLNNLSCMCGATPTYELMAEMWKNKLRFMTGTGPESSNKTDGASI